MIRNFKGKFNDENLQAFHVTYIPIHSLHSKTNDLEIMFDNKNNNRLYILLKKYNNKLYFI